MAGAALCSALSVHPAIRCPQTFLLCAVVHAKHDGTSNIQPASSRRAPTSATDAHRLVHHLCKCGACPTATATAGFGSRPAAAGEAGSILRLVGPGAPVEMPAMSKDPLDRARQQLARSQGVRPPSTSQPIDMKRLDTLIARGREAAALTSKFTERVLLDMTCSATGRSYATIAERQGTKLLFVGTMPSTSGGDADAPQPLSGSYTDFELAPSWICPECRTTGPSSAIWFCHCAERNGAVHCGSTGNSASFCACGRYEQRRLILKESLVVSGAAFGVASQKPLRGSAPRPAPGALRLSQSTREK